MRSAGRHEGKDGSLEGTALRELREETGILNDLGDFELHGKIGELTYDYLATRKSKKTSKPDIHLSQRIFKTVCYFLVTVKPGVALRFSKELAAKDGTTSVAWVALKDLASVRLKRDEVRAVLRNALSRVQHPESDGKLGRVGSGLALAAAAGALTAAGAGAGDAKASNGGSSNSTAASGDGSDLLRVTSKKVSGNRSEQRAATTDQLETRSSSVTPRDSSSFRPVCINLPTSGAGAAASASSNSSHSQPGSAGLSANSNSSPASALVASASPAPSPDTSPVPSQDAVANAAAATGVNSNKPADA